MIIISPSKNLNLSNEVFNFEKTSPSFLDQSLFLSKQIKKLSTKEIKSLMKISENLAKLNFERFQGINSKSNIKKPAGFIFSGDTFHGLSIRSFSNLKLDYIQKNLRILSGLYGMLRPFDIIEPYRLEMGTKIDSILGISLYEFWREKLTKRLKDEIKQNNSEFLFNLASQEYSSVLNLNALECKVISFDFKKLKNGKLSGIGMMIKKLRGEMAKYILLNNINSLEKLKKFNFKGFVFSKFDKSSNNFLFITQ